MLARFVYSGERLDIFFEEYETSFDVGAVVLAVCAYPETSKLGPNGPANRFWEAFYFLTKKGNRSLHPIAGAPAHRPSTRSANAQLKKGFKRVQLLHEMHAALRMYWMSNGVINFAPSRDLSKLKISLSINEAGRLIPGEKPRKPSIYEFLKYHQPAAGLGSDEMGSGERENAKTLRKRVLNPSLRVAHVLGPLRGEILKLWDGKRGYWPSVLLKSDPAWALRVVEKSRIWAPIEVATAKRHGLRAASLDRMIHFHLPRHVRILPPPSSL
jgi:hypothetical protein